MDLLDRITKDPQILAGKPTIRGMRISVELVMERLGRRRMDGRGYPEQLARVDA